MCDNAYQFRLYLCLESNEFTEIEDDCFELVVWRGSMNFNQNIGSFIFTDFRSFPVCSDERQDVQKKTFTKWINSHLSKGNCPLVSDLFVDLRDGNSLLSLLETLCNQKFVRTHFMAMIAAVIN